MKYPLVFLLILCCNISVFSQQLNTNNEIFVSGNIINKETKHPLEYATITAYHENQIVRGTISDERGKFKLGIPDGTYKIIISSLGYNHFEISERTFNEDKDLGIIELTVNLEELDEVLITAKENIFEINLDKKIYNIAKDRNSRGKTVSQVLQTIPSVDVGADGTLSIRGNTNPNILIDGNPLGFSGNGLSQYLEQLPSESIDKIEIITNPSARYDAEGISGIINIVLKKEKSDNLGLATTLSTGIPDNHGISTNLSYRKNKTSLYSTAFYKYIETLGVGTIEIDYLNTNDSLNRTNERRKDNRTLKLLFLNGGMFHRFDNNNSLNVRLNVGKTKSNGNTDINFSDFDSNDIIVSKSKRVNNEKEEEFSFEASTGFKWKFKNNSEISLNFEYGSSSEELNSNLITQITEPSEEDIFQRVFADEKQSLYILQTDYELPFKSKKQKIEIGYKGSVDIFQNDYIIEQQIDNDWQTLPAFTDEFKNNLLINAVYAQYSSQIEKTSILFGLRGEHTRQKSELNVSNENIKKTYTNIFPTATVNYKLNDSNQIRTSYSRRIRRPEAWTLNPFLSFSNNRVFFSGNPDLDPIYTSSYDVNYILNKENTILDIALYHQYSKNSINYIIEQTGDTTNLGNVLFRRFPANNGNQSQIGADINSTIKFSKNFNVLTNVNLYNSKITNTIDGLYNANQWLWYAKFTTNISLPFKLNTQFTIRYRSPRRNDSFRSEGIFVGDFYLNKDVMKGNGSFSLSISDIFNTQKSSSITTLPTFISENNYKYRQRQLLFSFTYRFNARKREPYNREEKLKDEFEF